MKIAYHFTIPPPARPELDGAVQEALCLAERFGGEIHYLYPARRFHRVVPTALCGARSFASWTALDRRVDVHHLFVGSLRCLPLVWRWKSPMVVSVLSSLGERRPGRRLLPRSSFRIVTPVERDRQRLAAWGVAAETILPPVAFDRFVREPPPTRDAFRLLAASGPWNKRQFNTKGFELLLAVAASMPELHLVFLWRGNDAEAMRVRVARRGLTSRVDIVEGVADVSRLLASVHAAVVLSRSAHLVKGYPQSLLEALATGRPVVASRCLAISEFIDRTGCGVVVPELTVADLKAGIRELITDYDSLAGEASAADLSGFSPERFLADYGRIYRELAGDETPRAVVSANPHFPHPT